MRFSFKFMSIILLSFILFDFSHHAYAKQNECIALNYHRIRHDNLFDRLMMLFSNSKELKIYSITDRTFERQMKWLKKRDAHFVTLDELIEYKNKKAFPKRCVFINFDDMDTSIPKYAQPILEKYQIPAAGFVITGEVGNKDFHNIALADLDALKELQSSGLWTFGIHTDSLHATHKNSSILTERATKAKIIKDINRSKRYLEQHFDSFVYAIAYPYGQTNTMVVEEMKKANIDYGFTLQEDVIDSHDDNHYLPRILVSNTSFERVVKHWEGFK